MTDFNLYDETNAPEAARPVLATAKSAFGFVPNLLAKSSDMEPVHGSTQGARAPRR